MLIKNGRMKFDNFIIEKYIIFDDCRIRLIIMNTFIQFILYTSIHPTRMAININKAYHRWCLIRKCYRSAVSAELRSSSSVLFSNADWKIEEPPLGGGNIREGLIGQLSQYRKRPCPSGKLISKLWNKLLL